MGKASRVRLETCFVFFMFVLGVIITVTSWGYGFGSLRRPGPGLYPVFIGVMICFFTLFILLSTLRSKSSKPVLDWQGVKKLIFMAVTFCLWIVAMPLLGYVVVTFLATYAFCKIMKLEGWWKPLALSGGTTLFVYLMFDYWLYVDFPRGILG
jgi:putative tricarboxylic transport membrane protein